MRRIALVYSANPAHGMAGMDMIRWAAMGKCFKSHGFKTHLVTDRRRDVERFGGVKVKSARSAEWRDYDALKVCYQASIDLVPPHPNLIVRMCRVVDERHPRRDDGRREELMRQQQRISEMASMVAFNDEVNAERWRRIYGESARVLIVPTGCPEVIPEPAANPFPGDRRIVLFCGSLTSHRFPGVLNRLARRLRSESADIELHFVGKNSLLHYAGDSEPLDESVVHVHGPVDQAEAWQYMLHAHVGVALAPSADVFESELSKIYYYLRSGLPVVTESVVPNRGVIAETGHGAVAAYDDLDDLAAKTIEALGSGARDPRVMQYMVDRHGWMQRARTYVDALGSRWQ